MLLKIINVIFGFILKSIDKISEYSKIPVDKVKHFLGGGVITIPFGLMVNYNTTSTTVFLLLSIIPAFAIGAGKELIWDGLMDKGTVDFWDFVATVLGGIAVLFIFMSII